MAKKNQNKSIKRQHRRAVVEQESSSEEEIEVPVPVKKVVKKKSKGKRKKQVEEEEETYKKFKFDSEADYFEVDSEDDVEIDSDEAGDVDSSQFEIVEAYPEYAEESDSDSDSDSDLEMQDTMDYPQIINVILAPQEDVVLLSPSSPFEFLYLHSATLGADAVKGDRAVLSCVLEHQEDEEVTLCALNTGRTEFVSLDLPLEGGIQLYNNSKESSIHVILRLLEHEVDDDMEDEDLLDEILDSDDSDMVWYDQDEDMVLYDHDMDEEDDSLYVEDEGEQDIVIMDDDLKAVYGDMDSDDEEDDDFDPELEEQSDSDDARVEIEEPSEDEEEQNKEEEEQEEEQEEQSEDEESEEEPAPKVSAKVAEKQQQIMDIVLETIKKRGKAKTTLSQCGSQIRAQTGTPYKKMRIKGSLSEFVKKHLGHVVSFDSAGDLSLKSTKKSKSKK